MTNQIIISDIAIHKDAQGRYSLNDLHQASGGEEKNKPANWLRSEKTVELIDEIINAQIRAFNPVDSRKGRYGGTYVCKELVYSYAMWISAAFALKVIRAYDALVSGDAKKAERIAKTSADDRTPLRGLVNRIMGKTGIHYQQLYKMIHHEFGVNHINELTPRQTMAAMEYLADKVMEGELLPRATTLSLSLDGDYSMGFFSPWRSIISEKEISRPWLYKPGHLAPDGYNPNPCQRLLNELKSKGINVEAALFQLLSLQHHLDASLNKISSAKHSLQ